MIATAAALPPTDLALVDRFQRDLPLTPRPYRTMGEAVGISEASVIARLDRYQSMGLISRIGAVFRPHSVGMSTLAALAVPSEDLERVAELVNAYAAINHNYEREHRYNLWFVVTGKDATAVDDVLTDIETRTGLEVLRLPLIRDFHIDLGFSLSPTAGGCEAPRPAQPLRRGTKHSLSEEDRELVSALEPGLALVRRPFREIAQRVGVREESVIRRLEQWLLLGIVRRLGIIVRHHELGYRANGMVVWNLPESIVERVGRRLATCPSVTLCYERPRRLPQWPYNLFTMIHGKDRQTVLDQVSKMAAEASVADVPREVLFSLKRFKQRGARYAGSKTSGVASGAQASPALDSRDGRPAASC